MNKKPKIIVFASGTKDGGGSGLRELAENIKTGILNAKIVAVVSNHSQGGVYKIAKEYNLPFEFFEGLYEARKYQEIIKKHGAQWACLSGWLKLFSGHPANRTINIHPGLLPELGGKGMYGHFVHEAAIKAYRDGKISCSAVTMHFVTEKYDEGPIFFEYPIMIRENDTAESLGQRVNKIEHAYQPWITNLVVNKQISWDGKNTESLVLPGWYPFYKKLAK